MELRKDGHYVEFFMGTEYDLSEAETVEDLRKLLILIVGDLPISPLFDDLPLDPSFEIAEVYFNNNNSSELDVILGQFTGKTYD